MADYKHAGWRRWVGVMVAAGAMALSAGCRGKLPEAESAAAKLYVAKCNDCHTAYNPKLLTPDMWQVQVARMESNQMRRAGISLSADERRQILDYLTRNAGKR